MLGSHDLARVLVRPACRVLDVGCGPGLVAEALTALGCEVTGLDISIDAVAAMAARGLTAHRIDLDIDDLDDVLPSEQRFDVIVCLDVLEHTKQPESVLQRLLERLEADGDVVISLPNVTHGDVVANMLDGKFEYQDDGLLDHTHLQFFDRQRVDRLVKERGLEIRNLVKVTYPLGSTSVARPNGESPRSPGSASSESPDAETYQWVLRASRAGCETSVPPLVGVTLGLQKSFDGVEAYARTLEMELSAVRQRIETIEALNQQRDAESARVSEELDLAIREINAKDDALVLLDREFQRRGEQVLSISADFAAVNSQLAAVTARRAYRLADRLSRLLRPVLSISRILRRRH